MNDARRKRLEAAKATLEQASDALIAASVEDTIDEVASEERDAFDNLPEGLQQGDKGQAMEAAADALDEAKSQVDSALEAIGEAINKIEEAKG